MKNMFLFEIWFQRKTCFWFSYLLENGTSFFPNLALLGQTLSKILWGKTFLILNWGLDNSIQVAHLFYFELSFRLHSRKFASYWRAVTNYSQRKVAVFATVGELFHGDFRNVNAFCSACDAFIIKRNNLVTADLILASCLFYPLFSLFYYCDGY